MTTKQSLLVRLRPGVRALAGVLSVLHTRAAVFDELVYSTDAGIARVRIGIGSDGTCSDQLRRLAAQLERQVDVLSAQLES